MMFTVGSELSRSGMADIGFVRQKGEGESSIRLFARRYPGIRLKLHNVTGRDGMAMLRADQADFAIGSMLEVPDDVTYQPVVNYAPALMQWSISWVY